jgi:hypothetical protein
MAKNNLPSAMGNFLAIWVLAIEKIDIAGGSFKR